MKMWLDQARERGLVASESGINTAVLAQSGKLIKMITLPEDISEADFQTRVIDLARQLGWRVAHFRKTRVQRKDGSTFWETPVAADGKGFL